MATTDGPRYPTDMKSALYSIYNDNAWVNVAWAATDDGAYGSVVASTFDAGDNSFGMHCRGFGFAIPEAGTILGIKVEVERMCLAGAAADACCYLMVSGTVGGVTTYGDNYGSIGVAWTGVDFTANYGGPADLWGTTWTPAQINGTAFGVLFAGSATGANTDIYVDFVRATVTYDYEAPPSAGGLVYSRTPCWGRF